MAPRSTWKGFLKLSLVSVPVKAYSATTTSSSGIHLNQLHAECNSRINYKKTCPMHGELGKDDIVSGYEYAKDQYVVIDTDELKKLRTEDDKAVNIKNFIKPEDLDPIYQSGKTYYLVPDGPVGEKPYSVLLQGMVEQDRYAIAEVVLHGKEQVVLLRPMDDLLAMTVLNYDNEVVKPETFKDEVPHAEASKDEMALVKTLIDASTAKKFDFSAYKDLYTERLSKLIEAKVAGQEIVAAPAQEHAHVINLMDALKQSVAQIQGEAAPAEKPAKRMAPSKDKAAAPVRRRKSS